MRTLSITIIVWFTIVLHHPAYSKDLPYSIDHAKVNSSFDELSLVGQSKLRVLFWDVYESSLYSQDGTYRPNHFPLTLKIRYLRDIEAKDLVKQTAKEWKRMNMQNIAQERWLSQLADLWPDLKTNDELLFFVDENFTNQFYYNGDYLGSIDNEAFAPQFLAIWLSEKCRFPTLRKELIGQRP